jgi:LEA14-like dessication related protein
MAGLPVRYFASLAAARGVLLVALAAATGGCGAVGDLLGLQKPSARLSGVRLRDVGLTSATMLFDVEVTNPYAAPLPLVNLDYSLASAGRPFLADKADLQGTIPANGRKVLELPAKLNYARVLEALKGVRPGAVVPYEAELGLSVDAPAVGALRLPLRKEGKLPVPAAPDVAVTQVKWDRLTLDRAGGKVTVAVTNRNRFAVEMSKLTYALSLGGVKVADAAVARSAAFEADGGKATIEIPLAFSPKQLGLAVFGMLTGRQAGYRLRGALDLQTPFGPMSLPVDRAGKTIFRK